MSPTLVILAAGLGRRYGGLKQIDRFGPSGETLMDYALFDAQAAGFAEVVFVIRHGFENDFRTQVGRKYESRLAVEYAFQERDELPPGFLPPVERSKPWGTTHAIWCARHCVKAPFASVNADDYYGKSAYRAVAQHLLRAPVPGAVPEYCMVGYPVLETLSEHGAVARAICQVDRDGFLQGLVERTQVERSGDCASYRDEAGRRHPLTGEEVVSMNMFGFTPSVFDQLERHLASFLAAQQDSADNAECLIPVVIDRMLKERSARMRVLPTSEAWFGVTHARDKLAAMATIARLVGRGEYPSPIWNDG